MKLHFSATNPCHVYDLARELEASGDLGVYYSGYPRWRLRSAGGLPVRTFSFRTCLVYGLLKFFPEGLRPSSRKLFQWQDEAFDQAVSKCITPADFFVGIPGQCRESFRVAKRLGIKTVLSHATGPMEEVLKIMRPEYLAAGLSFEHESPFNEETQRRHEEEYLETDCHWVPSSVVREQLMGRGIPEKKIWAIPFGADPDLFIAANRGESNRILFVGQFCLRKGIRLLLQALEQWGESREVHCFGPVLEETRRWRESYRGKAKLVFHGPISQEQLSEEMRRSSLLLLPSLEESFGLVVPQALSCGMACLVSDRVGAKDLIMAGKNGEVVASGSVGDWVEALERWKMFCGFSGRVQSYDWKEPARQFKEAAVNFSK